MELQPWKQSHVVKLGVRVINIRFLNVKLGSMHIELLVDMLTSLVCSLFSISILTW